jgi:hypothetical protein
MKTVRLLLFGASLIAAGCSTTHNALNNPLAPAIGVSTAADVLIISATYGSGTHFADVTYRVNDLLRHPDVEFVARPDWLGADPTPGWNKALVILYEFKRQRQIFATGEGGKVSVAILKKNAQ